ncbi:hypothetical protein EHI8A_010200 [Entamoeba histolytica HM-1:IMSS-B]|uniref:Uncharacterized protein n=5 Tax=Entamoeba TaxID=5758 RepID=M3S574_ENTH1|nr:hypothetical protein ENU1_214320 [Entamoeba nuttalli P19]EKE36932.1 hypothetical protein ENU1_214320 [Entamoeba nuttalli P19]EMH74004.1 hypothetical protein EHI8A_010200 [Entamoeba histolytica HM-1:IMSS-B]EMS13013.1 hypothetical protein KM1_031350 [Entamoeba histolytica HM-3:IMSS]ENY60896.1 unknown protein, putative [Entamoeba histolytica HM-1:IMSS-A]|eukprot:XP_008860735.1 hypothetical protein ENU1_214320 [Entamoeba nuttalli P19]
MTQSPETNEKPMTITEFNDQTEELLKCTTSALMNNEESIKKLLDVLNKSIEEEQNKIKMLDQNIEQFEKMMNNLTSRFQHLFNKNL